jgi:hypothetical protein
MADMNTSQLEEEVLRRRTLKMLSSRPGLKRQYE